MHEKCTAPHWILHKNAIQHDDGGGGDDAAAADNRKIDDI